MVNPPLKMLLKLNKLLTNVQAMDMPLTPAEQTVLTPVDTGGQPSYFYLHYNDSDDILPDGDSKVYSMVFTPVFDQLVMGVYSDIVSRPTTTPFSGMVPPSGIVLMVANDTMTRLRHNFRGPVYDAHQSMTAEMLAQDHLTPVFLQLIRKRLIDLCITHSHGQRAPEKTTVLIGQGLLNALRQYSISNMLLTDVNLQAHQSAHANPIQPPLQRTRLRLSRLSRHNSTTWLHVGNMSLIHPNQLTESFTDYVPQLYIQRLANSCGMSMVDYTPPQIPKMTQHTPPDLLHALSTQMVADFDDFTFFSNNQPRMSAGGDMSPRSDQEMLLRTLLLGGGYQDMLDLPFMLAVPDGAVSNGFAIPPLFSLAHPQGSPRDDMIDPVSIPNNYSLSDKKRDSLKMKRGIM